MNQNIKNFIENGEKEWDKEIQKLDDIYYGISNGYDELDKYLGSKDNLLCRDRCYPESQYELDPEKVIKWYKDSQISLTAFLIKMIIEEIEKIPTTTTLDELPPFRAFKITADDIKDTISSKLKELYEK